MSRVLVAHASRRPRARRITEQLAERLRERGHEVEVACARDGRLPPTEDYDAVVLGSEVALGWRSRQIRDYVRDHREDLAGKPNAYFSVSSASREIDELADRVAVELSDLSAECSAEFGPMS